MAKKKEVKVVIHEPNRADLARAIRLVWDSLDSHLDDSVSTNHRTKEIAVAIGNEEFHRKCVKEYADILMVLAAQL